MAATSGDCREVLTHDLEPIWVDRAGFDWPKGAGSMAAFSLAAVREIEIFLQKCCLTVCKPTPG